MLNFLLASLIGISTFTFYILNTIFWLIPILIFSFLKVILPFAPTQKLFSYFLDLMASNWIACNMFHQKVFTKLNISTTGIEGLQKNDWYLVLANHQSWVDIIVLQTALHGKAPFLKFFLKKELIYVPILGLAWWALDFPFMKRYSQAFLRKNPHLKGKDLETTRIACAKFKHKPVSVMSFIEGTRHTDEKYIKQNSPYKHLLKPKAGGIAFVLDAMGDHLTKIVDVTIYYPEGVPTFVDFLCGRVSDVRIDIFTKEIQADLSGDYFNDRTYKIYFQKWLTDFWHEKDERLNKMMLEDKNNNE